MPSMQRVVASALVAHALTSAGALMAQTSLTIYNDGRVLVRRSVDAPVPKGASQHRLALGQLEPGSLVSFDPDVAIVGTTYDGDVSLQSALRRMVGRQLTLERPRAGGGYETLAVTLIGVDPFRFRMPDGTVAFDQPGGQLRFPEEAVTATPSVSAAVQSAAAKKTLRLGWFTGGADWSAGYDVVLGRDQARVAGRAVLSSSALAVQDAEVQLLAGAVSRGRPEVTAKRRGVYAQEMAMAAAPRPTTPASSAPASSTSTRCPAASRCSRGRCRRWRSSSRPLPRTRSGSWCGARCRSGATSSSSPRSSRCPSR